VVRKQPSEKQIEMLAAAFLAGEDKKPKEIATQLGINAVDVSRYLKEARDKRYLMVEARFLPGGIDHDMMEKVRQRVTRQELEDKLNSMPGRPGQAPRVSLRVLLCGDERDERKRMRKLGALAAPLVRTLLLRSTSCGLTWGGMLESVVAGMRDMHCSVPWKKKEHIEFIPLSGEPLGGEPSSFSSSNLARDLGLLANGDKYDAPSLAMVPAFVPDGFQKYEREGVWRLIELVKAYHDIFGPHDAGSAVARRVARSVPKAMKLDMILTSVGSLGKPLGFGLGILFDNMNISYHVLKSLLAAEVGGVCIPRADLTRAQREQLKTVQTSWTGLRLEHLEACARLGERPLKGPPGVVVVSAGTNRATAVCELIKRGLVNHLIVDDVLAEELEKASR